MSRFLKLAVALLVMAVAFPTAAGAAPGSNHSGASSPKVF